MYVRNGIDGWDPFDRIPGRMNEAVMSKIVFLNVQR
jgi:hypothetical protein